MTPIHALAALGLALMSAGVAYGLWLVLLTATR